MARQMHTSMHLIRKPQGLATSAEEMSEEEQIEVVKEEEEEMGLDVSPSGMADDLTCADDKVANVLLGINEARTSNQFPRLTCSDRSTGTAANWAYLVAEKCASSSHSSQLGGCPCIQPVTSQD